VFIESKTLLGISRSDENYCSSKACRRAFPIALELSISGSSGAALGTFSENMVNFGVDYHWQENFSLRCNVVDSRSVLTLNVQSPINPDPSQRIVCISRPMN
jgi:hypothetical protein